MPILKGKIIRKLLALLYVFLFCSYFSYAVYWEIISQTKKEKEYIYIYGWQNKNSRKIHV